MKRLFLSLFSFLAGVSIFFPASSHAQQGSAYDYSFTTLTDGKALPLSQFKGKVLLIVNTASKCGFTPQYEGLQKLYDKYKDKGLVIIGVPSNDFRNQEPGSSEEIAAFCQLHYGVTFPMTKKEVVTGEKAHPFYQWARATMGAGAAPKWNFHKYLINKEGKLVNYFYTPTAPDAGYLVKAIETLLNE